MHGGTYNSNADRLRRRDRDDGGDGAAGLLRRAARARRRLADGLVAIARDAGFEDACWSGIGSLFQLWFARPGADQLPSGEALVEREPVPDVLQREMLEQRGILSSRRRRGSS